MSQSDTLDAVHAGYVAALLGPRRHLTILAQETGCPLATISSWKRKGSIPPWRRPAVLDAVRRLKLDMPDEVIAYLGRS